MEQTLKNTVNLAPGNASDAELLSKHTLPPFRFEATDFPAGSEEKVEVLRQRYHHGFPLWHEYDRTDYAGLGNLSFIKGIDTNDAGEKQASEIVVPKPKAGGTHRIKPAGADGAKEFASSVPERNLKPIKDAPVDREPVLVREERQLQRPPSEPVILPMPRAASDRGEIMRLYETMKSCVASGGITPSDLESFMREHKIEKDEPTRNMSA